MASKDFHTLIQSQIALVQQAILSDTTTVGLVIGTHFFESIEFNVQGGLVTGTNSSYQLILDDGNDPNFSDVAPVASEFLIGDPSALITASNEILSLGYVGHKAFVRASILSASTGISDNIEFIGIIMIGDSARHFPFIPPL